MFIDLYKYIGKRAQDGSWMIPPEREKQHGLRGYSLLDLERKKEPLRGQRIKVQVREDLRELHEELKGTPAQLATATMWHDIQTTGKVKVLTATQNRTAGRRHFIDPIFVEFDATKPFEVDFVMSLVLLNNYPNSHVFELVSDEVDNPPQNLGRAPRPKSKRSTK